MSTGDPEGNDGWEAVVALMQILRRQFDGELQRELAERFSEFAGDELSYRSDEMESEDELARLQDVAHTLGAELNEKDLILRARAHWGASLPGRRDGGRARALESKPLA